MWIGPEEHQNQCTKDDTHQGKTELCKAAIQDQSGQSLRKGETLRPGEIIR